MRKRTKGYSLLELLAAIAIIAMIALCAMPAFASYRRRMSAVAASHDLRGILRQVRSRAIARGRHAGVKFTKSGDEWMYALYDDGDGDGIRNDDIKRGVDKRFAGPSIVLASTHIATIGLLKESVVDPDGDPLYPDDDAVQFNRSTICSFSPNGGGTPGTVYIVDGAGVLWAARVSGAGGRVRLLQYDDTRKKWESR